MAKVKFKLDLAGLNQLMKSGEMQAVLNSAANQIAAAAGAGYEVEGAHAISFVGIASVYANTYDSYYDALENDTLQKIAGGVKL